MQITCSGATQPVREGRMGKEICVREGRMGKEICVRDGKRVTWSSWERLRRAADATA